MQNRARDRQRAATRARLQLERPRCMICGAPLRWGQSGLRYDTVTCGKACAKKRWEWFQREGPH